MKNLFFILIIAAIAGGSYWYTANDSATDEAPYTVRIGHMNIVTSLMLFVAEEKGWFEEAGIKTDVQITGGADFLVQQTQAGNFDVYINSSVLGALAANIISPDRVEIFLAHPWYKNNPFDSIFVKKNSDINQLSDLEGKKIGIIPSRLFDVFLKYYFDERGIANVNRIPVGIPNQLVALETGSIDALHTIETVNATAIASGKFRRMYGSPTADVLNPMSVGHGGISTKYQKEHPEQAKKVVEILTRGIKWVRDNEEEARQILVKRLNLTPEAAAITNLTPTQTYKEQKAEDLKKFADFMFKLGELPREVTEEEINKLMYQGN